MDLCDQRDGQRRRKWPRAAFVDRGVYFAAQASGRVEGTFQPRLLSQLPFTEALLDAVHLDYVWLIDGDISMKPLDVSALAACPSATIGQTTINSAMSRHPTAGGNQGQYFYFQHADGGGGAEALWAHPPRRPLHRDSGAAALDRVLRVVRARAPRDRRAAEARGQRVGAGHAVVRRRPSVRRRAEGGGAAVPVRGAPDRRVPRRHAHDRQGRRLRRARPAHRRRPPGEPQSRLRRRERGERLVEFDQLELLEAQRDDGRLRELPEAKLGGGVQRQRHRSLHRILLIKRYETFHDHMRSENVISLQDANSTLTQPAATSRSPPSWRGTARRRARRLDVPGGHHPRHELLREREAVRGGERRRLERPAERRLHRADASSASVCAASARPPREGSEQRSDSSAVRRVALARSTETMMRRGVRHRKREQEGEDVVQRRRRAAAQRGEPPVERRALQPVQPVRAPTQRAARRPPPPAGTNRAQARSPPPRPTPPPTRARRRPGRALVDAPLAQRRARVRRKRGGGRRGAEHGEGGDVDHRLQRR